MFRRDQGTIALLLACLTLSPFAHAGDSTLAESLFREGRSLMEKGDYGAACPKLKESFVQDPATGTLMALAMCQEHAGQIASAWTTFSEVATRARRDGRTDREEAARESIQALEPRLSRLTIDVGAVAASTGGLVVKRDGTPFGRAAWGSASPVDPGEHVVEAEAPGKKRWKTTVKISGEKDAQTVHVPTLEDAVPGADATTEAPESTPSARSEAPPPSSGLGTQKIVALVSGGVGLVGLGVGTVFGLQAMSKKNDAEKSCDGNTCSTDAGVTAGNDAHAAGNVATIGMVVGAVGLAGGLALWFSAPKKAESVRAGLGFGTVHIRGAW